MIFIRSIKNLRREVIKVFESARGLKLWRSRGFPVLLRGLWRSGGCPGRPGGEGPGRSVFGGVNLRGQLWMKVPVGSLTVLNMDYLKRSAKEETVYNK
jgi:hypothetical protein